VESAGRVGRELPGLRLRVAAAGRGRTGLEVDAVGRRRILGVAGEISGVEVDLRRAGVEAVGRRGGVARVEIFGAGRVERRRVGDGGVVVLLVERRAVVARVA